VCVCVRVRARVHAHARVHVNQEVSRKMFLLFFNFVLLAIVVIVHAGKSRNPQHQCEAVLTLCGKKCYSAPLNNTVMHKCLKTNHPEYFLTD